MSALTVRPASVSSAEMSISEYENGVPWSTRSNLRRSDALPFQSTETAKSCCGFVSVNDKSIAARCRAKSPSQPVTRSILMPSPLLPSLDTFPSLSERRRETRRDGPPPALQRFPWPEGSGAGEERGGAHRAMGDQSCGVGAIENLRRIFASEPQPTRDRQPRSARQEFLIRDGRAAIELTIEVVIDEMPLQEHLRSVAVGDRTGVHAI